METAPHLLPSREDMLAALYARDASCDGLFYAGVTTTGVFCRPSCPARDPRPEHVEFYATAREALVAGFRPCRRCHPLEERGTTPAWMTALIARVEAEPSVRISDAQLRAEGLDPALVRRRFQVALGMTFQAYARSRRLGEAFKALRSGASLDDVVFDHGWQSHSGFRDAFVKATGAPPGRFAKSAGPPGGGTDAGDVGGEAGAGGKAVDGRLPGGAQADPVRLGWVRTPLGDLVAGATGTAVCLLEFPDRRMMEAQLVTLRRRFARPVLAGDAPLLDDLRRQLAEYFAGERQAFDLPLAYPGTQFQRRVWDALLAIPYGETRTYADIAREIGAPGAARAVGHANGLNRIAIVIPCHRVIAADGGLGGYGGGLWRKLRLLETEGWSPG
jgi:AraC family transcriptional regulator, regulatory protein of adaptative response / methylated-DNA-[protein]-cysteine methyltransferase